MHARSLTSRTVVAALVVLTLAATAGACSSDRSDSSAPTKTTRSKTTQPTAAAANAPCTGPKGVGSAVPAGLGPGDLVGAVDLTSANQSSEGFPTDARVWRILYVSSGVDEHHLQLVCGLAAAPKEGPKSFDGGSGRMLAWAHGTVGVQADCLPASDPAKLFWGKMPGGIGAPAWSTLLKKTSGQPDAGALQYAMDQGWVVAATDYQPETYVLGSIAGANVLDANRATAQLLAKEFADTSPDDYDFVTWGHSQGGHSAIWAGQLAETYLAGTKPSKPTAGLHLVGVAAEAPASNFVAQPSKQPGVSAGNGLTDWEMHQVIGVTELPIAIPKLQVQIGPALFSYIFGSWSKVSSGVQPASDATFPAFPVGSKLDESSLITPGGRKTVDQVLPNCLTGSDAKKIQAAVGKYRHAEKNQMLIPSVWNLPADYSTGAYFHGGTDKACAELPTDATSGLATWCQWIRWNLPGPAGVNPFPKVPLVDGQPVPMLIAQGEADTVIHCVPAKGVAAGAVPAADDCMSRALYDSVSADTYCPPDGIAAGHLELDLFRKDGSSSPATHFSVPGQIGAKGTKGAELTFAGSPMQQFMATAFDGTAQPGCTAKVMNP